MPHKIHDLAKQILHRSFEELTQHEQHVVRIIDEGLHVSRNTNREFDDQRSLGQRLADRVAAWGGSWPFIILFGAFLLGWIVLNSFLLVRRGKAFDPYPYILLNLVLSTLAAIQAPVIMMSQNRLAAKDRLDAAHDYEVNLKAEYEIMTLHQKLDTLREQQWTELLALQQEQIRILTQLLYGPGARNADHTSGETK